MTHGPTLRTTGIAGLDLVLGGGLRFVERVAGAGESATVLVRGAAGTGKTLLAMHLAAAVAKALSADVAVACVELLPLELETQLADFVETRPLLPVRVDDEVAAGASPRLFARMLQPQPEHADDPMGDEVVQLLEWVTRCGGDPRVLVVDSLSDGYGLGGKIARAAADALAKLAAQRGLCLILVEEVTRLVPTPWCFAVDTVLELRLNGFEDRAREDRSLSVTKHRFGPSDAGPHELDLAQARLTLLPEPDAWDRAVRGGWWTPPLSRNEENGGWGNAELEGYVNARHLRAFAGSITYVVSDTPGIALQLANLMGNTGDRRVINIDLSGERQRTNTSLLDTATTSPHRLQSALEEALHVPDNVVGKVVLGDLRVLRGQANERALRAVIARFTAWLRGLRVPVVLYETASPRLLTRASSAGFEFLAYEINESWRPEGSVGENVRVEVVSGSVLRNGNQRYAEPPPLVRFYDLGSGQRVQWVSVKL